MSRKSLIGFSILSGLFLTVWATHAQPESGMYQIVSGRYTECCGIAGPFVYNLPNNNQALVDLRIDPRTQLARMSILGQGGLAVFRIPQLGPRLGFTYSLSNGVVHPDRIEFGEIPSPTPTGQPPLRYTVSNYAGGLILSGTLYLGCLPCADIQSQFKHTNVVAVSALPRPIIQGVERDSGLLRFRFTGEPGNDYFVEFTESLPASNWLSLTNFRAKLEPIEAVVTDALSNSPARYYRIRKQDCQCD